MKTLKLFITLIVTTALISGCQSKQENMKNELVDFINKFDSAYIPLYKASTLASWDASISGKPEDFKKSEDLLMKMVKLFADKESLKKLETIKVSGLITDSLFFVSLMFSTGIS